AIREHMIIDGKPVSDSQGPTIPVYDPATGQVIAHQPEDGAQGVDLAVRAARQALEQGEWGKMLLAQRERLLLRLADLVEANADELARLETLNNAKLLFFSYGLEVVDRSHLMRYISDWSTKISIDLHSPSIAYPSGIHYHASPRPERVGVFAAIVPRNIPLLKAVWKIATAMATGCTMV